MSERLEEFRRRLAGLQLVPTGDDVPEWDEDLIPAVDPPAARTEEESEVDRVISSMSILDAYQRWCGKAMERPVGSETKVSCPVPGHEDANPSACINTDKNCGCCYACDVGFDVYDIYAWHAGFPVPDYKTNGQFPDVRRNLAAELGVQITRKW